MICSSALNSHQLADSSPAADSSYDFVKIEVSNCFLHFHLSRISYYDDEAVRDIVHLVKYQKYAKVTTRRGRLHLMLYVVYRHLHMSSLVKCSQSCLIN